jgi:hypothetical protein
MDDSFFKIVDKLIEDLPDKITNSKEPIEIDLVLDSGAFNGSYAIGALYFLKEMERRNLITVKRISGSSIGSVAGLLYLIDELDVFYILYNKFFKYFKKEYNLKIIKNIKKLLKSYIPNDLCSKVNNKLFIKYNNINCINGSKIKSVFENKKHLYNTIISSCFIPFLIDGNISYKDKYIDGLNPYIFEKVPNRKIIMLDLLGVDKIINIVNVKNEKSNFYRILYGALDMHIFFTKETTNSMCSYVDEWDYLHKSYFFIRIICEKIICIMLYIIILIKKNIYHYIEKFINFEEVSKIIHENFVKLFNMFFF